MGPYWKFSEFVAMFSALQSKMDEMYTIGNYNECDLIADALRKLRLHFPNWTDMATKR